jgi:hypothetical protein
MLTALVAGGTIAFLHAACHKKRRILWLGIVLLFFILAVASLLPSLS